MGPHVEYRISLSDHVSPGLMKVNRNAKQTDLQLEKTGNRAQRTGKSMGGLGKGLLRVGAGFGALGAAMGVMRLMSNAVGIFKDFEKSAKGLEAIFGEKATVKGMKELTDQAKQLGAKTAFTASEILSLDTELAKLGFDPKQIKASVEGISSLAAATGIDLATAATIAGSALNIFGLDASEASRVSDILAKSTTMSALDMTKISVALPYVGTAAKLAGKDLEWTTARLGTLSDRGMEASTAGTSMRMMFAKLAQKGISYKDALDQINNSTNKYNTALKIFGVKSATAAVILAETTDKTDELEASLRSADGFAKQMADTMLDNLAGDITIAGSAWEGFILSLEDGNGIISKTMRGFVQLGTAILQSFTEGNAVTDAIKGVTDSLSEQFTAVGELAKALGFEGEIGLSSVMEGLGGILRGVLAPLKAILTVTTYLIKGFTIAATWIKEMSEKFKAFKFIIDAIAAPIKLLIDAFKYVSRLVDPTGEKEGKNKKVQRAIESGDTQRIGKSFGLQGKGLEKAIKSGKLQQLVDKYQGIGNRKEGETAGIIGANNKLGGLEDLNDKNKLNDLTKKDKDVGIDGIKAASPQTFIVNIDKFIENFGGVNTTNMTEGVMDIKQKLGEAMMEMVNDVSILAGQK